MGGIFMKEENINALDEIHKGACMDKVVDEMKYIYEEVINETK